MNSSIMPTSSARFTRALLFVALSLVGALIPVARAVYGGRPATAAEAEGVARLTWHLRGESGTCSGVLVGERAILTAAHCARAPGGAARRVRSATVRSREGEVIRATVTRVIVHEAFDPDQPERGGDLALLLLDDRVPARPVPLATEEDERAGGREVEIVGYGASNPGRLRATRRPRRGALERLSPHHCFSGPVDEMARTRSCAASPTMGVCPGDSGAPAIGRVGERRMLFGLVSLAIDGGPPCSYAPAILTRVSAYRDWVRAQQEG